MPKKVPARGQSRVESAGDPPAKEETREQAHGEGRGEDAANTTQYAEGGWMFGAVCVGLIVLAIVVTLVMG